MNLKLIIDIVGSLFPVVFPKQEFKPRRLVGAVCLFFLVSISIDTFGLANTEAAIELTEEVMELTEEQ